MGIIESIIYGFVSGLTEIIPVSSQANQHIMRQLFGVTQKEPIRDMLVHIAVLVAILFACRALFMRLRRDQMISARMKRGRNKTYLPKGIYELRLIRSAVPVLVLGLILGAFLPNILQNTLLFAALCLINGVILMVPAYMHQGNKTAKAMTGIDGLLIGFAGALCTFPGISRVGSIVSMCLLRKTDKVTGFNWAMLLSLPALAVLAVVDIVGVFTIGVGSIGFVTVVGYFLSAGFAFAGTYLAITLMKILIERAQLSGFAYYSFGIALLSFLIYLIT